MNWMRRLPQNYQDKIRSKISDDAGKNFFGVAALMLEESCGVLMVVYSLFTLLTVPLDMTLWIVQYALTGYVDAMTTRDSKAVRISQVMMFTMVLCALYLTCLFYVFVPIYLVLLNMLLNTRDVIMFFVF